MPEIQNMEDYLVRLKHLTLYTDIFYGCELQADVEVATPQMSSTYLR